LHTTNGLQVERFFQEMKMNLNAGARCCTVKQLEASPGSIYGQNTSSFYHSLSVSLTFKANCEIYTHRRLTNKIDVRTLSRPKKIMTYIV